MNQTEQQQDIRLNPPGEHQAIPTKNIRSTRSAIGVKRAATLTVADLLAEYNIHRKGVVISNNTNANLFCLLTSEDSDKPTNVVANGAIASRILAPFTFWEIPFDYCGRIWGILGAGAAATEVVTVTELF